MPNFFVLADFLFFVIAAAHIKGLVAKLKSLKAHWCVLNGRQPTKQRQRFSSFALKISNSHKKLLLLLPLCTLRRTQKQTAAMLVMQTHSLLGRIVCDQHTVGRGCSATDRDWERVKVGEISTNLSHLKVKFSFYRLCVTLFTFDFPGFEKEDSENTKLT